jgi:hypothetical protein
MYRSCSPGKVNLLDFSVFESANFGVLEWLGYTTCDSNSSVSNGPPQVTMYTWPLIICRCLRDPTHITIGNIRCLDVSQDFFEYCRVFQTPPGNTNTSINFCYCGDQFSIEQTHLFHLQFPQQSYQLTWWRPLTHRSRVYLNLRFKLCEIPWYQSIHRSQWVPDTTVQKRYIHRPAV